MDRHRNGSTAERWPEILLDWQTDHVQLLYHLEQLKGVTRTLYAMLYEYRELAQKAQTNIDDARALTQDINCLAERFGLTPVLEQRIELPGKSLVR
jgi:hypothetical protein